MDAKQKYFKTKGNKNELFLEYSGYYNHLALKGVTQKTIRQYFVFISTRRNKLSAMDLIEVLNKSEPQQQRQILASAKSYYKYYEDTKIYKILCDYKLKPIVRLRKNLPTLKVVKNKLLSKFNDPTDEFQKRVLLFILTSGIRVSELWNIQEIKPTHMVILGKGNKKREIFYDKENWEILKYNYERYLPKTDKAIRDWTKRIIGLAPHDLRRIYATHLLSKGANPKMVQLTMGHSKIDTTFSYIHNTLNDDKNEYDKYI